MQYTKQAIDFSDQLSLLKQRGLIIDDEERESSWTFLVVTAFLLIFAFATHLLSTTSMFCFFSVDV